MDAIVIRNLVKHFRKRTIRGEYTSLKTELVRWIRGQRGDSRPQFIEALKGIDLTIPRGRTVGIIGRNGSGKSTLLKLITGIYTPTSGTLEVNGRISALVDLGAGFHPDFSGRENILINGIILGMTRNEVRARMPEIIAFSELGDFIDEPVRTYSSGMYMRLAFAVATHVDPEILIIDEILAVGDQHFTRKSFEKLNEFKRAGKTIVLVTHDLATMERWCDLAAWIDGGRIRAQGEPRQVVEAYHQAVALAESTGSAALSAPGLALPELPPPPPSRRDELRIEQVRLLTAAGGRPEAVDPEDALTVAIDYAAGEELSDAGFAVELKRADGTLLYGTSTFLEGVALPVPLPRRGTVSLALSRVGLTQGSYAVDVLARTRGGEEYDASRGQATFTVKSRIEETGLLRPSHAWSFAPEAAPASAELA